METITSYKELEQLVLDFGFLPFFRNEIAGFSVEEHTPAELWFSESEDGPWEWKGPVAKEKNCAYGKLFRGRAGFVSLEWLPALANYRRDGYDFDARFDDGLVARKDKLIYDAVSEHGSLLTRNLKSLCGFGRNASGGFDTAISRLQMQTYVCVADFEYMTDRCGNAYGWGMARYSTPESLFGRELVTSEYKVSPEKSGKRIAEYLSKLLPNAADKQIERLIG